MKSTIKILGLLLILGLSVDTYAQQIGLFSQYVSNDYMLNPAISGTKNYIPVHSSIRRQWIGITEAPVTQTLSVHAYTGQNFGIGAAFFNEVTGPTRRTGINFSTAYHLVLKQESFRNQLTLSIGMQGSLTQNVLDKTQLTTFVPEDPTIQNSYNYQLLPDVGFGAYLHQSNKFYVGISSLNLVQTKYDLYNLQEDINNRMVRNYFVSAGGNFDFKTKSKMKISLQPSVLFRMIEATPMQFDINLKAMFNKTFWTGISYRHNDAMVALIGVRVYQMLVGYSYDFTISNLKNYTYGSHELSLTLILNEGLKKRLKKGGFVPKNYRPSIPSF
jgi:type IX secretion system PorP/SprF family membrane protein